VYKRQAISTISVAQNEIIFQTEDRVFSPLIVLNSTATVLWTFADGTTSTLPNPYKNYATQATRINKLKVTPWNAVEMINIGFDGSDGGWSLPVVPDQHVSKVSNINLVKNSLRYWCSSYNLLDSLSFDNFINLEVIESFYSFNVKHVSLKNLPRLKRLCMENNNLITFDISECTALEDVRGALNNYKTINFGNSTAKLWHICVRDNPQITNDSLFFHMERFPDIAELYIWNTNQSGTFKLSQNNPDKQIEILAANNNYSAVDLRGSLQNEQRHSIVDFSLNKIRSIDISDCKGIKNLNLDKNGMTTGTVDAVLRQLDELGTTDGFVTLTGNSRPSPNGLVYKHNLENKNWSVIVDGPKIEIIGNDSIIENGDTIPKSNNYTNFGNVKIDSAITKTFYIRNMGSSELRLTKNPTVSISGSQASYFSVIRQPGTVIGPLGGIDSLKIKFSPKTSGICSAIVSIENDGIDNKNNYNFAIEGFGQIDSSVINTSGSNVMKVYPNPTNGEFTVLLPSMASQSTISLVNSIGLEVYNSTIENKESFSVQLPHLLSGVYLLYIKNYQKNMTCKIIVKPQN
jgi:hypothetical protein